MVACNPLNQLENVFEIIQAEMKVALAGAWGSQTSLTKLQVVVGPVKEKGVFVTEEIKVCRSDHVHLL